MKLFLLITIIILFLFLLFTYSKTKIHHVYGTIARTPHQKKRGLMFRKYPLKHNEGMLFVMGQKINTLWMKNTFIPLDIIFLTKDMKVVGYIEDTEPLSLETLSINKPSYYVIEMNGNSVSSLNINIGDHIIFHKN
jgi:uncharacterized protein